MRVLHDKRWLTWLAWGLFSGALFLAIGGCGSGGNVVAVTPVMADTKGTYRLASSAVSVVAADGTVARFLSYSTGTLRVFDDGSYQRTVVLHDQKTTSGIYFFGSSPATVSATTILNSRLGSFVLSSPDPAHPFKGVYEVTGDYLLTLNYQGEAGQSLGTRSNIWIKVSDSPHQ